MYETVMRDRDERGRFAKGNRLQPKASDDPAHRKRLNRGRYLRARQRYTIMTFRLPKGDALLLKHWAKKNKESIVERLRTYIVWGIEVDRKSHPR